MVGDMDWQWHHVAEKNKQGHVFGQSMMSRVSVESTKVTFGGGKAGCMLVEVVRVE